MSILSRADTHGGIPRARTGPDVMNGPTPTGLHEPQYQPDPRLTNSKPVGRQTRRPMLSIISTFWPFFGKSWTWNGMRTTILSSNADPADGRLHKATPGSAQQLPANVAVPAQRTLAREFSEGVPNVGERQGPGPVSGISSASPLVVPTVAVPAARWGTTDLGGAS